MPGRQASPVSWTVPTTARSVGEDVAQVAPGGSRGRPSSAGRARARPRSSRAGPSRRPRGSVAPGIAASTGEWVAQRTWPPASTTSCSTETRPSAERRTGRPRARRGSRSRAGEPGPQHLEERLAVAHLVEPRVVARSVAGQVRRSPPGRCTSRASSPRAGRSPTGCRPGRARGAAAGRGRTPRRAWSGTPASSRPRGRARTPSPRPRPGWTCRSRSPRPGRSRRADSSRPSATSCATAGTVIGHRSAGSGGRPGSAYTRTHGWLVEVHDRTLRVVAPRHR